VPALRRSALLLSVLAVSISSSGAEAQYYNTHSGHPGRIEDASPVARRSIDVDLFGIRLERLQGGITRTRLDPGITWGALPQTEIAIRLPVVWLDVPGASTRTAGVAGVAVRVMHAFNLETPGVPAFGVSTEALLPAGGLAAPGTSYIVRVMATKRSAHARWHVNAGAGGYSVRTAMAGAADSGGPPIIIDVPCSVSPAREQALQVATDAENHPVFARTCLGPRSASISNGPSHAATVRQQAVPNPPKGSGARWMAGAGVDRPLALQSVLLSANVLVERFEGLYAQSDMYAESGIRWQASPRTVVDAGISWRFAGAIRALSINVGTSIEVALPLLVRRPSA